MSNPHVFKSQFDENGHFLSGNGELPVVFATRGGGHFPGTLRFRDGKCIRAEMERGGHWGKPDESPLDGVRFLLKFEDDRKLCAIAVDKGRIVFLDEEPIDSTRHDFLANFRIARNLSSRRRDSTDDSAVAGHANRRALAKGAIWLTPKSVAGFKADDFPELAPDRRQDLLAAYRRFLTVANEVPADSPATDEQIDCAKVAIDNMAQILDPYLPPWDNASDVEIALKTVEFPTWVLNWDYELGTDSDGLDAVWIDVFVDEQGVQKSQLGRAASELNNMIREALQTAAIHRWPYVRLKTAMEYKAC